MLNKIVSNDKFGRFHEKLGNPIPILNFATVTDGGGGGGDSQNSKTLKAVDISPLPSDQDCLLSVVVVCATARLSMCSLT